MRTTEATQLQSLRAVQSFLDRHRHALADVANGGARRRLDATLAGLDQHVVDQAASDLEARGHTQRYRALRRRLIRTHMAPIALIARAAEPPVPALDPFRLPRGKPTAHRLAALAHGMADAAAPHAEAFTAAGLPDDFAAQLVQAAEAMLAAITAREKERARHRGATEGLRRGLVSARRIVRVLNAFVTSSCEEDAGLLAGWQSAMHVRRTASRAAGVVRAVPNAPPQLMMVEATMLGYGESNEQTPDVLRRVGLGRRVMALLGGSGRERIDVEG